MDYEKKYKETLERAKELLKTSVAYDRFTIERIFPELKENEDERIRKGITSILEHYKENGECVCPYPFISIDEAIAWLEKQGEKKPIIEMITPEESLGIDSETYNKIVNDCIFGENKPKFKVGNWVISTLPGIKYPHLITDIRDGYYIFGEDDDHAHIASNDDVLKLWTIQDAENGDVLSDGTTIFIFKDLLSDGSVMSYCDYDTDSGESDAFCPLSVNLMCSKITPTTKEQRDILFQKMKEARYMWDSEKKELKNIEQNSAWSEEDNKWIESLIQTFEDGYLDWLKSLRERYTWKLSDEQTDELENEYLKSIPKY